MIDKKLFAKNSISGFLQKILIAVLTFYTIPIFIKELGDVKYGIFGTLTVLIEFGRLVNVGFNSALIKFLSNQGKTRESSHDILVALITMLVIILVFAIPVFIFNDFIILHVFNIDISYLEESRSMFNYMMLSSCLLVWGIIFSGVLESQKKIYLVNMLQLVYSVIYWSSIIAVVHLGYGLPMVGLAAFIAALIWFILSVSFARKTWGMLHFIGLQSNFFKVLKKQLSYSAKIYVGGLLGLTWEPLIKILVSNFFGVTYVGFLDIGFRIRNQLYRILQSALWPLFQLFSELKDQNRISTIIQQIEEKIALLVLPLSAILIFIMHPVIELWIGDNVNVISFSVLSVTVGSLIGQLVVQPNFYYWNAYRPTVGILNQIIKTATMVIVLYALYKTIGYKAVYWGFIITNLVQLIIGLYFQKRFLNSMIFTDGKEFLKLISGLAIMFATGYITYLFLGVLNNILYITTLTLVISVSAFVVYREFRLLRKNDVFRFIGENSRFAGRIAFLFHS
ncbi:MAG: oligosaccharide flippase family protein [Bacteroidetes bacterium]|jgi:O-antigen/teichoic acid export membrane protein|nr:oligosaccharide flippase family protein [Bacteroidota bacterium]